MPQLLKRTSFSVNMLSLILHVQRTELWKWKHPVVDYWCYLCIFICVALIQKSEKCKRWNIFVKIIISFILKWTNPNVNPWEDINKKALSVEHEVAYCVCVAWHLVLASLHVVSSGREMNKIYLYLLYVTFSSTFSMSYRITVVSWGIVTFTAIIYSKRESTEIISEHFCRKTTRHKV